MMDEKDGPGEGLRPPEAVPAGCKMESISPERLKQLVTCAGVIVGSILIHNVKGRELCKLRILVEMLLE